MIDYAANPTKKMLAFLRWMDAQGHVELFPTEYGVMRQKAKKAGLIKEGGIKRDGAFVWTLYSLSDRGRELAR